MKKYKILNYGRVHSPELAPRPVGMRGHLSGCPLLLAASALRPKPSGKYPGACSGRMVIYCFFIWVIILTGCDYGAKHESIKVAFNASGIGDFFSIGDKKSDIMSLNIEKREIKNGEYEAVHIDKYNAALFFQGDNLDRIQIKFHDDRCIYVYKTNNKSIILSHNTRLDRFTEDYKDIFHPVTHRSKGYLYTNNERTLLIEFEKGCLSSIDIQGVTDFSKIFR